MARNQPAQSALDAVDAQARGRQGLERGLQELPLFVDDATGDSLTDPRTLTEEAFTRCFLTDPCLFVTTPVLLRGEPERFPGDIKLESLPLDPVFGKSGCYKLVGFFRVLNYLMKEEENDDILMKVGSMLGEAMRSSCLAGSEKVLHSPHEDSKLQISYH